MASSNVAFAWPAVPVADVDPLNRDSSLQRGSCLYRILESEVAGAASISDRSQRVPYRGAGAADIAIAELPVPAARFLIEYAPTPAVMPSLIGPMIARR